jgi:hypothetical protein
MAERIFESAFHKQYVGGDGEVVGKPIEIIEDKSKTRTTTEAEVLSEYRKYVGDPSAELPEEIKKTLLSIQRTENEGV